MLPDTPSGPNLPVQAWLLGWAYLAAQVVYVLDHGTRPVDAWTLASMLLGALLVTWVASGVLQGRTVRLVLVWVVTALVLLVEVLDLAGARSGSRAPGWPALELLTSLACVGALIGYTRTPYFRWQRSHPRAHGPSRAPVLMLAVVVGLLGGVSAASDDVGVHVRFGAAP